MLASVVRHRAVRRGAILKFLGLIAACCVLSCVVWLLDRFVLRVELTAYIFSYGFFANSLLAVLTFLLLLAISNRMGLSFFAALMLAGAMYFADHQKLKFLDLPLSFNDFFLVRDLDASAIHLLANYVKPGYLLIALLALIIVTAACFRYEPAFFQKKILSRALLAAAVVLLSGMLVVGNSMAVRLYDPARIRVVPWSPMVTILHTGLLGSIEYANLDFHHALDVPADPQAIRAFLGMASSGGQPSSDTLPPMSANAGQHPDIVIVQSESFFDPAILSDIATTQSVLPNLHRALRLGTGGTMKAPTFGGGTLRTEFEVLTGIPMDAYPRIDFPYLQISQKTIPSLVGVLHEDGYKAYAVHGNSGGFWNRAKAFKEMGFDRFFTKSDFPAGAKLDGWFLSDEAMTDKIIDVLGDASSPTLIFAVSIEGHGPYDHVPVSDVARRDELPVPAGWPAAAVNEYKNYLYHITNADQQLGRLWAYLESRHRPYVLAFYGDHLPGLQHVYAIHGFDDQSDGPSEFVPWFVVSSSQTSATSKHIFSWMLGAEILDAAGLPRPPYYQALGAAERLLAGNADAARKVTVENGIYSIARLYLNGRFDRDMPKIEAKETSQ